MKIYNVTVNGNTYQVEVEEVKGEFTQPVAPVATPAPAAVAPQQPVAAPQPVAPAPTEAPKPVAKPNNATGEKIECPMPGTIVKVNVTEGATVKKGDVLVVLEAMKMENEIMSPVDGTIAQVNVAKGVAVNSGDLLVVIA
ncbi:biotin/lipoyl-containing protein [Clostridium sp. UBA4548]|uniref:biotin/lipoyl-containing protein n=1 Tax=Clostridium sp. UBA4548 TaxID=1946361 RepID=UPI0025C45D3D|nr:biotin/lipoyl-containing protein [Clostridium sp. UBA4548]